MRAPSLLSQCWPGLVPSDRGGHSISTVSERDSHLSSPAVEILPSKVYHCGWLDSVIISPAGEISVIAHIMTMLAQMAHPYRYAGENVDLQGFHVFKVSKNPFSGSLDQLAVQQIFGQEGYTGLALITCDKTFALWGLMHEPLTGIVSVADIFGFTGSEMTSAKPDGSLKSWDSSTDLVSILRHEIRDGQLSFRGKRVLELGCSYGLSGIFSCLKGASTVHFQDLNAETIRCTTIPNVLANLEQARDRQSQQPESPLTPSRYTLSPSVHFYAGDWEELPTVLSTVRNESSEVTPGMSLSFSEEDFMDGCSSQDGSIIGQEQPSRRSRKLSGSRAWERANETDHGGGYDVILITDIPYSLTSLKKLYSLIKKCLRPPYGVLYLATKRNYVGFSNGARHLKSLVDEEGIFGAHLVKEMTDRDIWKFFFK